MKPQPCYCGEPPCISVRRNLTQKYTEIEIRCPTPGCWVRPRIVCRGISKAEAILRWNDRIGTRDDPMPVGKP